MHRNARSLAHCIQTVYDACCINHLTINIGRYAAHHIVASWYDWNRIFNRINIGKGFGNFTNTRQAFVNALFAQMVEL